MKKDDYNTKDIDNHSELLKFPCDFPVKVFGKASEAFEREVLQIFHNHFRDLTEGSLQMRHSKDNNYLSMTVTVKAISKAQLDTLYQELSAHQRVIMAL
ncbi:MAG: DUF493 domain-containing protein [Gammaproteobacteria bacterium]|nr:DUF493 domain-containing protein [Gammaproteobacteria bacterium]